MKHMYVNMNSANVSGTKRTAYAHFACEMEGHSIGGTDVEFTGMEEMKCSLECSANAHCYAYTSIKSTNVCRIHTRPAADDCILKLANKYATLYNRIV